MQSGGAQAADAERREAAKRKADAKTKKLEADEKLHLAAKTNNVRCVPVFCCMLLSIWRSRSVVCCGSRVCYLSTILVGLVLSIDHLLWSARTTYVLVFPRESRLCVRGTACTIVRGTRWLTCWRWVQVEMAKECLQDGAEVNKAKSGWCALHFAASKNSPEVTKLLCENGADINVCSSKDGWSALHWACSMNNVDVAKILIGHKADLNLPGSKDGSTPLGSALLTYFEPLARRC